MSALGNILGALGSALLLLVLAAACIAGLIDARTWKVWWKLGLRPNGKPVELLTLPLWIGALPAIAICRGAAAIALRFTALRKERRAESEPNTK